jgi:predicted dehydrogenase
VGFGPHGRGWAKQVIPEITEVDVVGYVDSDPYALDALRETAHVPAELCFESLREAIATTEPQALLNTTALPGHVPVTESALEAGLHVLLEKPFAPSMAAARGLVELAAAKRLVLMVSQNYRFFPAVRTAARLVHEGALGELYEVSVDFRRNDPAPPNPKRRHHTHDTQPLLIDMSIHHFDLLRLVLGRAPVAISCHAWNPRWSGYLGPPVGVASMLFEGDLEVSYRGSWISAGPETAWAGEWRMEFEHGHLFWTSRGEDNRLEDRITLRPRRGRARGIALSSMPHIDRAGSLAEFAASLRANREPETSGRDNLGTIALMTAAVESAGRREWVQVSRQGSQVAM